LQLHASGGRATAYALKQILLIYINCHGPERGIGLNSDPDGGRPSQESRMS
jgi:hypothetical protein